MENWLPLRVTVSLPVAGLEDVTAGSRIDEIGQDEGGAQSRVTAEIDFSTWSEPAQVPVVIFSDGKSSFGQAVFHCNLFHQSIRKPMI